MNWFKQAGSWLSNTPPEEHVPVETMTRHLLASLLTMAWSVEAMPALALLTTSGANHRGH